MFLEVERHGQVADDHNLKSRAHGFILVEVCDLGLYPSWQWSRTLSGDRKFHSVSLFDPTRRAPINDSVIAERLCSSREQYLVKHADERGYPAYEREINEVPRDY